MRYNAHGCSRKNYNERALKEYADATQSAVMSCSMIYKVKQVVQSWEVNRHKSIVKLCERLSSRNLYCIITYSTRFGSQAFSICNHTIPPDRLFISISVPIMTKWERLSSAGSISCFGFPVPFHAPSVAS